MYIYNALFKNNGDALSTLLRIFAVVPIEKNASLALFLYTYDSVFFQDSERFEFDRRTSVNFGNII